MYTIDEIKWYCKEKNPVGALLITGQWGCGKTYLIEHSISHCQEITSEYVIVRISLFGESSPKSVKKKTKLAVLSCKAMKNSNVGANENAKSENILNGTCSVGKLVSSIAKKLHPAGEVAGSLLAIDWLEFFDFPETIDGKRILLIFDDFERASMDTQDLLGCINEFVETLKIKTILIADEEKIPHTSGSIAKIRSDEDEATQIEKSSYAIFKEKIISRTVMHIPDYNGIVQQVIEGYNGNTDDYKKFLIGGVSTIQRVFRASETNNIRSLKCGIQDFERVYECLIPFELPDEVKYNYLSTFLAMEFESKNNQLKKTDYGYILKDYDMINKYVDFKSTFVIEATRKWLTSGEWNQVVVVSEIKAYTDKFKSISPDDMVLRSSIIDLDDKQFNEGFPIVIEKAYASLLSLDDYIALLRMCIESRVFGISFPLKLDKGKLHSSLKELINRIKAGEVDEPRGHTFLTDDQIALFTEQEKDIYKTIEEFREYEQHYKNKVYFMKAYKESDEKAIFECNSKYYKSIDVDMARAVANYYSLLNNTMKRIFYSEFLRAWRGAHHRSKDDINESIAGINTLRNSIEQMRSEGNIAGAIDRTFIKNLDDIRVNYQSNLSNL